jgi:Predicted UDP-glucose 6-dehydrogenase
VKVTVHDPRAIENTKNVFKNKINYTKSISDALLGSQCVIIMTQWKQYEKLVNNDFKRMKKKLVIDSRRMLAEKQLDVDYYAIGLGKE